MPSSVCPWHYCPGAGGAQSAQGDGSGGEKQEMPLERSLTPRCCQDVTIKFGLRFPENTELSCAFPPSEGGHVGGQSGHQVQGTRKAQDKDAGHSDVGALVKLRAWNSTELR